MSSLGDATQHYLMLDSASFTPPDPEAVSVMNSVLASSQANPLGRHGPGKDAARLLLAGRRSVAQDLGSTTENIIFTSGGTESANLGIKGIALARLQALRHGHTNSKQKLTSFLGDAAGLEVPERDIPNLTTTPRVLVSAVEHSSVLESAHWLSTWFGVEVVTLPVDSFGCVKLDALEHYLTADNSQGADSATTLLVAVSAASSEVGTLQPIPEIARLCHSHKVPVYVDAVQAAGLIPISLKAWDVDALGVSGHKVGSPTAVGALALREGIHVETILSGGGQERGIRSGTQDVATALGFAVALRNSVAQLTGPLSGELASSRDQLIRAIQQAAPFSQLTGHPTERLPGHASFVFPGITGESLLVDLDAHGIACSSGSACDVLRAEPPQALLALGFQRSVAESAVRFSFRTPLNDAQVNRVAGAVKESTERLLSRR